MTGAGWWQAFFAAKPEITFAIDGSLMGTTKRKNLTESLAVSLAAPGAWNALGSALCLAQRWLPGLGAPQRGVSWVLQTAGA